jgi:hypothetical protein
MNRQGTNRNAMFFITVGFVLAHFSTIFYWQRRQSVVPSSLTETVTVESMLSFNSNNNINNNNQQQQRQQQQHQPWASLSSTFPPPRTPPAHQTLDKEMTALGNWQMQSIASVSNGQFNPLCSSQNKTLNEKCLAMNEQVGKQLALQGGSPFLKRKVSGYNLKDFNLVVDNDMITVNQLSAGLEKILQGLKLH